MTDKRRTWGQYATPTDVADLLFGFCLRRPGARLLDPGCGDGALLRRAAQWRAWLASTEEERTPQGTLYGIELDPAAAAVAGTIPGATIARANFFTLPAGDYEPFDVIVGNPPYTRAEWFERLGADAGQMTLLPPEGAPAALSAARPLVPRELSLTLGGRAGLYAYFFLHSHGFLREGGRLGFVVPNGWLDVGYGGPLKRFILDHYRIVAVVESAVERWFADAGVNTCLVILERTGEAAERDSHRARFIRLRQPLRELLGPQTDDRRVSAAESLVTRLLPAADRQTTTASIRVREQSQLDATARWGALLRAPDVFLRPLPRPTAPLGQWATVQRGHTTGANEFFYLSHRSVERWGIEAEYRQPLLKSLRGIRSLRVGGADCRHELLVIPPRADLAGTAVADYLAWGAAEGIPARSTCAGRQPWYALPEQDPGPLLLAKGIWQRHFTAVTDEPLAVDQQIYRIILAEGIPSGAVAALLNSAWFALGCELGGRVNLGEGVLWLAAYELSAITLPDPRALDDETSSSLAAAFRLAAASPIDDTPEMLERPERHALDELVFDLLGFSPGDRAAARLALVDCLDSRRRRARQTQENQ